MNAFITAVSAFLPGRPVSNDTLDACLGSVDTVSAKTRRIILASNGIATRYYAIAPDTGRPTHTNAQLTAEAIRQLPQGRDIDCLCCGTSTPDQTMPGHASMVHGELAIGPCEIVSTAGICLTGVTALKYAAMAVALRPSATAVATGSELTSASLQRAFFQAMTDQSTPEQDEPSHPAFSFEAEFLRWMLSDGAGAALIEGAPTGNDISLRLDWIEILSHAHRLEACMYAGAVKEEDGRLKGWRQCVADGDFSGGGIMTIKQDARLLNREILETSVAQSLPTIMAAHELEAGDVDWFLPHYSSEYFRKPLQEKMAQSGFAIEEDRWFTNLTSKGNTGAASFYIMLEELLYSGKLRKGQRILAMVPESGRFSVGWICMTAV